MMKILRAAVILAVSASVLSPISAQAFTNVAGAAPVEKQSQVVQVAVRKSVPDKFKRRIVRLVTDEKPGTIIIDTDHKFLYYVQGKNRAVRYGVGVGRDGYGWSGVVKIGRKAEWPEWRPPAEMRAREARKGHNLPVVQKGGIDNPLGARAMYLYRGGRDTIFRIHGTNQPWTIGLNMSSGCIRMMNKDVEDLYERAGVGTKVIVIGPGNRQGDVSYDDRGIDLLATIFGG
ncbi:L,D-transpeptidase [Rhizobium halophytocola]|uniref:Lipoprotein-anchoring transpeptidase ErfK/SrfK n=1 Tax=Rhizobium halophytocola TaxID=735519 RepID=A0ABS4DXR5_9HYPH|nr:L,D-transpeptidase [Rhizobium halophytocola]MBP1850485.1 lipoprotein-anchoring transpeptidase ErfK/SrfK [Rhizobium halophytocola]